MIYEVRTTQVVPTHVNTPETVLSIGGLSLSARQFLLLLVGAALSYDLWKQLGVLAMFPGGIALAVAVALLPTLVASAFAFGRIAGRDLAAWVLTMLRYALRPKRLIWRSVRFQEPALHATRESEESDA